MIIFKGAAVIKSDVTNLLDLQKPFIVIKGRVRLKSFYNTRIFFVFVKTEALSGQKHFFIT